MNYGIGNMIMGIIPWLGKSNGKSEKVCCIYVLGNGNIKEKINGIISQGIKYDVNNAYSSSPDLNNPWKNSYKWSIWYFKNSCWLIIFWWIYRIKFTFMCRVNLYFIRIPMDEQDYWILNGNVNEIRPYRLLVKDCINNNNENDNDNNNKNDAFSNNKINNLYNIFI